ncbi:MAG: xylulokinase [Oscillospiraceae bacterium]|nr:xylulokinase [Oscillospiraceae bacterium]
MYFIGVDLGTSATKLLLMDETGGIRKIVSRSYPLSMPRPGWSEQDPAEWVRAAFEGIRELTGEIERSEVRGVGIAGQMHGLVALDGGGRVLRPAILWNDGRTEEETHWLNEEIGEGFLAEHTGNIAFAGFTAPKLLWMKIHEPELFRQIEKIMLPKDYLVYRLTGVHAADCSDASGTLLFDVAKRRWSGEMLELCSLRPGQMGEVFESSAPVGRLLPEVASELGLPGDTLVVAGAGDNAAAAVGTGTVGRGRCNVSVGTSGTLFLSDDRYVSPANHALHAFCHADGGWHLLGCELSAASCLSWWGSLCGEELSALQAEIDPEKLGKNRVFFLPYLMGERTPHNDALAAGVFSGMRMDSSRADLTQAVLEGVAFGLRDGLEIARAAGMTVTASGLTGGGAKSPLWRRILANVLHLELALPETEQGPGLGAAILAAVGCGRFPDVSSAAAELTGAPAEITHPEAGLTDLYDGRYRAFRALYPALKDSFALL